MTAPALRTPRGPRAAPAIAIVLIAEGLAVWRAGLDGQTPNAEWLAQTAWAAIWLVTIECSYGALLAAATPDARALDAAPRWHHRLRLAAAAAALLPLSVVAETAAQLATNRLLYDPGAAVPVYLGWFRGLIDSRGAAAELALTDGTLSAFATGVLGWQDETNAFAAVMCSAMLGNVLWATLALAIGTGTLRQRAPVLARAFRLAALQAATAPLFTLAYFFMRGGDGLNVWSSVLRVLVGTIDAGEQVPMWIRVTGVSIFFLLPAAIVAGRLRADRRAAGGGASPRRYPVPVVLRQTGLPLLAIALVALLLPVWGHGISPGPWGWAGQSAWLALWLAFLAASHRGLVALTSEGRVLEAWEARHGRSGALAGQVAAAWPLAVAGCVVQAGAQWVAAVLAGSDPGTPRFYGWFLVQVPLASQRAGLPAIALAAAFAGNLLWACALLWLARRAWRERQPFAARTLGLGALQAATVPVAVCAFMILSIITRDRAVPGMPRYDAWHVWTYLARAAADASFATESMPIWLRLGAASLLVGMPLAAGRACLATERRGWRAYVEDEPPASVRLPVSGGPPRPAAAPVPRRRAAEA